MNILNKIKSLDTKFKVLGVVAIALVFIIFIVLMVDSSTNSNNENYNNNSYHQEDNFGNNEDVTAVPKEDIVATNPDIEVVILSKKFGGDIYGYIEVTKASASVDTLGHVTINVEGIKGNSGKKRTDGTYWYDNPPIEYRVYDANDTLLGNNNVYVDNYENKEQGDICKGSARTFLKPEQVARIEIG